MINHLFQLAAVVGRFQRHFGVDELIPDEFSKRLIQSHHAVLHPLLHLVLQR